MLRINLLPPYIYDKAKKIPWIVGSLAMPFIILVMLLWWAAVAQANLDEANRRKADAQTQQAAYDAAVQSEKKEDDAVAATKAKQEFVASSIKYNEAWPQVYTALRDVTSPKVLLKSMYVSDDHKSLNFTGFCAYEEDLVRWWMYLRAQSSLYTDVHFRLPEHPWPPRADNTGRGAGGMMGSMMGGPGGGMAGPMMGGSMGGSGGGMAGPMMGGGMGASSAMGGAMKGGPGMMGGSSGGGSFGGGRGGNSDAVGPEVIEGRPGISFTATAVLKEPLAKGIPTPTWAAAGASAAGRGGGGPMGMGGMSGPMGMGGSAAMMGGGGGGANMATPPGGGMKGNKGGD